MKKLFPFLILLVVAVSCTQSVKTDEQINDIDKKVNELLAKMTLQEKIGQMNQRMNYTATMPVEEDFHNMLKEGKLGSILNALSAEQLKEMQRIAVEESRLGIPLLIGRDVIHGYRTIFPVNLGLAATFNPELVKESCRLAALEATSDGVNWTFAPMMDVVRDPRWGRIAESCGEDPYLATQLAVASVQGYQGDDLSDPNTIAATAKHFVGYGAAIGGRDYNTTLIPEAELRNVYLKPFKAVSDIGVASFMSGFNNLNGVPTSGNEYTLKTILRDEWGFKGFVVSDWASVVNLEVHGYASDSADAVCKAVNAGVDLEMSSESYIKYLEGLVKEGKVKESDIDVMVKRLLKAKYELGLFENPYGNPENKKLSDEAKAAAKKAVVQSAVLLQNKNKVLPISKEVKSVAVIGPLADNGFEQMGTWVFDGKEENSITPLTSLKEYLGTDKVNYVQALEQSRSFSENFDEAIAAAKKSDVVLLFMGDESILTGEAHCRAELTLPGSQNQLIKEISKLGKPTVLVIMTGVLHMVEPYLEQVDALVYGWHAGTMTGPGYVDLIFGEESFSGKMPMTMPRAEGQIPIYYNYANSGHPASDETMVPLYDIPVRAWQTSLGNTNHYLDLGKDPLFEFGYGLSYTEFKYENISVETSDVKIGSSVKVTADLTNIGEVEAEEIAQLYIRDIVGSIVRPVKELKGFQRVRLTPGETKTISFEIPSEELGFYNNQSEFLIEPGKFDVWVGGSSSADLKSNFSLIK